MPRNRSDLRRSISTVASKPTDMMTSTVATARMVGLICSRMPENIWRGISRPGKMRFEYDPPEQALVIAEASAVVIIDKKSNQPPETYPLRRTPLSLILARNINLARASMVTNHTFDGTATIVTAQDPENPEYGNIQMSFTDNPVQLRQWIVNDANGGTTTVILGEFETGMNLPSSLFSADRAVNQRDR